MNKICLFLATSLAAGALTATGLSQAVILDNSEAFGIETGAAGPQTFTTSYSVGADADFLVFIYSGEGNSSGASIDSILWDADGTPQGFSFGAREAGNNLSKSELWYLDASAFGGITTGAQDFQVSWSGTDFANNTPDATAPDGLFTLYEVSNTTGVIDIKSFSIDSGGGTQALGFTNITNGSLALAGGIANGGQNVGLLTSGSGTVNLLYDDAGAGGGTDITHGSVTDLALGDTVSMSTGGRIGAVGAAFAPIPEPSALALLTGVLALVFLMRRRRA